MKTILKSLVISKQPFALLLFVIASASCNKESYIQGYGYKSDSTITVVKGTIGTTGSNGNGTQGTITDIDGNTYKTIQIGTQIWMAENLKVTRYRNGNPISNVIGNWTNLTSGVWCYYNNDSQYNTVYGKLYNWYAVNDSRGISPTGWHIPTDAEYTILENYLGGDNVAGGKMKEINTTHWLSPNTGATNSSGFTALPGGEYSGGSFGGVGNSGDWWSATTESDGLACERSLDYSGAEVASFWDVKYYGFSVRCVKD